ncbi:Hormone-sensitive lipase [Pseudolycoriella hygida]|uniref:Hormone-sensitive lipase n=1 Tax=Pseudolycoriella hygida TaxID=35572 RepID=A0A9Q0MMP6_9DIPT|nr:Hormone-sensitive lipase [Pseudolycoriella hygida]
MSPSDSSESAQQHLKVDNKNDSIKSSNYFALYEAFEDLCRNNVEYFSTDETENGLRLHGAFISLIDHLEIVRNYVAKIKEFAHEYDFDEVTPGNGYRSFLLVVRACIKHSLKLSSYIMQNRSSLLFRKSMYMKEMEACSHLLASLCTCLHHLLTLREWSDVGSLFPSGVHTAAELFTTAETINQYCFYGRCLGIQYCESIQSVLRFLSICMAGFSEAYYNEGSYFTKTTSSMWTSGQYYLNPELRARRIVNISQNSDIDFCKSFWSLSETELMHSLPNFIGSSIKINKVITIPPEPLQLPNATTNEMIDIPVPNSHLGPGSVFARLISAQSRVGMMGEKNKSQSPLPVSTKLLFHCHGGGFVAQSSKSHELYLREWAVALDVPIFSVDYSLAPDAPFPRAVEEVFYAYCWAIKNCSLLGTTAETIVLAGDSAGANLNLSCAMKCIEMNVRKPSGVFLAYCPVQISFDPSPARLLCLMDPLLPFGFMMRCLKAYACPNTEIIEQNRRHRESKDAIKYAKSQKTTSLSGSLKVNGISESESDLPTFVHLKPEDKTENSTSMDGSSVWEHIDIVPGYQDEHKSPGSDGTSDTFASASLQSQTVGNTEMMTPDESNGISFEEDSQPITIHRPTNSEFDFTYSATEDALNQIASDSVYRSQSAAEAIEIAEDAVPSDSQNESTKYVNEFIERYVLDTQNERPVLRSVPGTRSEENILLDEGRNMISVQNIQSKIFEVVGNMTSKLAAMTTSSPIRDSKSSGVRSRLDSMTEINPADEFVFEIPKDPMLSPFWATDNMLKQMPRTHILSVDMDPCLDDCVMYAKRLKSLNNEISMDILSGLPHGFLNLVKLSKDAHEGNKVCIKRLKELLTTNDREEA